MGAPTLGSHRMVYAKFWNLETLQARTPCAASLCLDSASLQQGGSCEGAQVRDRQGRRARGDRSRSIITAVVIIQFYLLKKTQFRIALSVDSSEFVPSLNV